MKQNITLGVAVIAILIALASYSHSSSPSSNSFGATADCGQVTCLTSLDVSGDSTVQNQFGVGTTSPSQIDISALSTGTTTLGLFSSGTRIGGCIQLLSSAGTLVRVYATTTGPMLQIEAGSCR